MKIRVRKQGEETRRGHNNKEDKHTAGHVFNVVGYLVVLLQACWGLSRSARGVRLPAFPFRTTFPMMLWGEEGLPESLGNLGGVQRVKGD